MRSACCLPELRIANRNNRASHRPASPSPAPESARQTPPGHGFAPAGALTAKTQPALFHAVKSETVSQGMRFLAAAAAAFQIRGACTAVKAAFAEQFFIRRRILAAKKVVKKGIEIHNHANHKGRNYLSVTFAAPVEINGVKGIEAVVIKQTKGNRFSVARIIAPDGTAFVFKNKNDAEPTTGGGRPTTEAAAVYTPISSTSETSISDSGEKFNEKFSMKEDSDFEYDEDSNLTREQQRQVSMPEFKRWFGETKMGNQRWFTMLRTQILRCLIGRSWGNIPAKTRIMRPQSKARR